MEYLFFIDEKSISISLSCDLNSSKNLSTRSSSVALTVRTSNSALVPGLTEGLSLLIGDGYFGFVPGVIPGFISGLTPGLGELAKNSFKEEKIFIFKILFLIYISKNNLIKMDFYELQKNSLLLENIAAAKALLVKDYAEKQKKRVNEIPEEIKKTIWRDPKYKQILDLAQDGKYYENGELHPSDKPGGSKKLPKNEGWIYLLTKLYVIDGCSWEQLVSVEMDPESATVGSPTGIYNMMVELKPNLNQLPLKNIDSYARITPSEQRETPSYEILGDDLRVMQAKKKLKKIYDELIPRMKKEFDRVSASNDPKEKKLIQDLELFSLSLEKLKPRTDPETGEIEIPFKVFKAKTGMRFSDSEEALKDNPSFKDPAVAFRALVKECTSLVDTWSLGLDEYTEKLISLGSKAGILYNKRGYLVMSARTPESQRVVSGDTNFCISKSETTFWQYGEGAIQLNIINSNLPKANAKYLLGVTITKNGTVKNCAWKPNNSRDTTDFHPSGINYAEFLKKLGYPQDLIQEVIDQFQEEVTIKLSLEKFYKDSKSLTPRALILSLLNIREGIFKGVVSPEEWDQISGIVALIIREERGIPVSDFIKEFKGGGIFTPSAWEVFDHVVEGEYTKKDMEEIKSTTLEVLKELEGFIEARKKGKAFGMTEESHKNMLAIVKYKDENIAKMDALIAAK